MPYWEWLAQSCLVIIMAKQMGCQYFGVQVMCKGQSYLHDNQLGVPFDLDVLYTASQGCLQALYETSVLSKVVGLAAQVLTDACKLHNRMCHQLYMLFPVCKITRTRPREMCSCIHCRLSSSCTVQPHFCGTSLCANTSDEHTSSPVATLYSTAPAPDGPGLPLAPPSNS